MTEQEFAELLARGHETRSVEFKGPGARDDRHFFAKVARAMMGMANHRDGGTVIIGVEDDDGSLRPVGLTPEQLDTWRYDDVASLLASYTEPTINFDLETFNYHGQDHLIIHVHEFEDVPVLCSRDLDRENGGEKVLRKGACYVRSRRKPETSEIPTQEDMRNLLDLAIDKGIRKFVARAYRTGFSPETPNPSTADNEQYGKQVEDMV